MWEIRIPAQEIATIRHSEKSRLYTILILSPAFTRVSNLPSLRTGCNALYYEI